MKRLDDANPAADECKCGHTRAQHAADQGRECNAHELHANGTPRPKWSIKDDCSCEHFARAILPRRGAQLSLPNVRPIFERKP